MNNLTVGYLQPLQYRGDLQTRLESEFDRFFGEFFNPSRTKKLSTRAYPKVDLWREEEDLLLEATVPGLTKEQISIVLNGDILTIKGESVNEKEKKDCVYITKEIKKSLFERSFQLTDDIVKKCPNPEAKLENGLLRLTFKGIFKDLVPEKRQISIN